MSMLITPEYAELNRDLHERRPDYGTGGHKWSYWVSVYCQKRGLSSVLDYGSGKGTLAQALEESGLDVREYDPAIPGKDVRPSQADLVVCTDVLEHVEPECIRAVLDDIVSLATGAVLLGICCKDSAKTLADGRQAHILVRPKRWWQELLSEYGLFRELPGKSYEYNAVMRVRRG